MTSAEMAYLFRHALLRDAAYELQLPGDRARLHEIAFFVIEQTFGGRAPEAPTMDGITPPKLPPHPTDPVAFELAEHARLAIHDENNRTGQYLELHKLYLHRAAEYAEGHYLMVTAAGLWKELASHAPVELRGLVLHRLAEALTKSGRVQEALVHLEEALQLALVRGDRRQEGTLLRSMAGMCWRVGRMQKAEECGNNALSIMRELGDRWAEGVCLGDLAVVYMDSGRREQAERAQQEALAIHRETGNRRGECIALGNLGGVYSARRQLEMAVSCFEDALAIAREIEFRPFVGTTKANLGAVLRNSGRAEVAEVLLREALSIAREVGDRRGEGVVIGNLAQFHDDMQRHAEAEAGYRRSLDISREVGNLDGECLILTDLATMNHQTGRLEQAREYSFQAVAAARRLGSPLVSGRRLCKLALTLLELKCHQEAEEVWREGAASLKTGTDSIEVDRLSAAMREACAKAGVPPFDECEA